MNEETTTTESVQLNGYRLRTAQIGSTEYVAVKDFCGYLQGMITKLSELTRRQQEQMSTMSTTLDILCDVLGAQFPDLDQELLKAAQFRRRPV
jgi:hypothetical protein